MSTNDDSVIWLASDDSANDSDEPILLDSIPNRESSKSSTDSQSSSSSGYATLKHSSSSQNSPYLLPIIDKTIHNFNNNMQSKDEVSNF